MSSGTLPEHGPMLNGSRRFRERHYPKLELPLRPPGQRFVIDIPSPSHRDGATKLANLLLSLAVDAGEPPDAAWQRLLRKHGGEPAATNAAMNAWGSGQLAVEATFRRYGDLTPTSSGRLVIANGLISVEALTETAESAVGQWRPSYFRPDRYMLTSSGDRPIPGLARVLDLAATSTAHNLAIGALVAEVQVNPPLNSS